MCIRDRSTASASWSTVGLGGTAAGSAPGSLDDVVIGSGYTITTSGLFSVNSIVIQAGGTMTVNSSFRVIGLFGSVASSLSLIHISEPTRPY